MRPLLCALVACCLLINESTAQDSAPLTLGYQGFVTDLGRQPINGDRDVTFRLYSMQSGGQVLWEETIPSLTINEGVFQATLGLITPLPDTESPDSSLFLSIQLDGDVELQPRMRVGAAIRAQWSERSVNAEVAVAADHATDVLGEAIHPSTVSIGDVLVIDSDGRWVGQAIHPEGEGSADPVAVAVELANDTAFRDEIAETLANQQAEALRGERGLQGERGEQGPPGLEGARGQEGPQGINTNTVNTVAGSRIPSF